MVQETEVNQFFVTKSFKTNLYMTVSQNQSPTNQFGWIYSAFEKFIFDSTKSLKGYNLHKSDQLVSVRLFAVVVLIHQTKSDDSEKLPHKSSEVKIFAAKWQKSQYFAHLC